MFNHPAPRCLGKMVEGKRKAQPFRGPPARTTKKYGRPAEPCTTFTIIFTHRFNLWVANLRGQRPSVTAQPPVRRFPPSGHIEPQQHPAKQRQALHPARAEQAHGAMGAFFPGPWRALLPLWANFGPQGLRDFN